MANTNETVAGIVNEMREYAKRSEVNGGEVDVWNWLADFTDRIEAAHKRNVDALNAEIQKVRDFAAHVSATHDGLRYQLTYRDEEITKLREAIERIYKTVDNNRGADVSLRVKEIIAEVKENDNA